jgi:hypothetical protein
MPGLAPGGRSRDDANHEICGVDPDVGDQVGLMVTEPARVRAVML